MGFVTRIDLAQNRGYGPFHRQVLHAEDQAGAIGKTMGKLQDGGDQVCERWFIKHEIIPMKTIVISTINHC